MPDKQIVIKLDEELFETMMRLALAAGYTSLDAFASERLRETLNSKPQQDNDTESTKAEPRFDEAALSMAAEELHRIHQELRVFIKEAAAESDLGVFASPAPGEANDQWEELAEIAFSKSPRLGSPVIQGNVPPDKKRSDASLSTQQAEPDPYGFRSTPTTEDENPTPGGFSDLSGGPPPRKRSK